MTTRQASPSRAGLRALTGQALSTAVLLSSSIASAFYARGRSLRARLGVVWAEFAASLRRLADTASLAEAESPEGEGDKGGVVILGLSGVALVLVIGAVVLLCILPVCVIIILALLGPAIGNVFSNVVEEI